MYSILLSPSAAKDYKKIPKDVLKKINKAIDSLSRNPCSLGYKKLKNRDEVIKKHSLPARLLAYSLAGFFNQQNQ